MRLRLHSPAVDEQPDWEEEAANGHHVKTMLGSEVAALNVLRDDLVAEANVDELADEGSDADTGAVSMCTWEHTLSSSPQERETDNATAPAVLIPEHNRKRGEQDVQVCIRDGHV